MPVKERFKDLIKKINTNPTALGKSMGLSQATIKNILDGTNLPSSKVLIPLLELYPTLNINWLLIGQGDMFLDDTLTTADRIAQRDRMIQILESSVRNLEHTLELQKKTIEERDVTILSLQEQIA